MRPVEATATGTAGARLRAEQDLRVGPGFPMLQIPGTHSLRIQFSKPCGTRNSKVRGGRVQFRKILTSFCGAGRQRLGIDRRAIVSVAQATRTSSGFGAAIGSGLGARVVGVVAMSGCQGVCLQPEARDSPLETSPVASFSAVSGDKETLTTAFRAVVIQEALPTAFRVVTDWEPEVGRRSAARREVLPQVRRARALDARDCPRHTELFKLMVPFYPLPSPQDTSATCPHPMLPSNWAWEAILSRCETFDKMSDAGLTNQAWT
eukprot:3938131-Rhodomonas_salina.2